MTSLRRPSPARSQVEVLSGTSDAVASARLTRRTRSVGSPARSNNSGRLSSMIQEYRETDMGSFVLSPLVRRSILPDNTDIEEPKCKSWWQKLDENSRDVIEVLEDNKFVEPNNIIEELDIEILSQEKNNFTLDLPESSDSESINSIVIPPKKLFTEKENQHQKNFGQFGTRDTLSKLHKTKHTCDNTVSTVTKELFQNKPRSKPLFPSALLIISPNKTTGDKTLTAIEPKGQVRNLFGNRQGTKRKNMFANFIVSESEDEIPDIQPNVFRFQKRPDAKRHSSASSRGIINTSPTSSITTDMELDEWKLLPSSTMVENQLEVTLAGGQTPKRAKLSKLSEAKESDAGTNSTKATNRSKQSNKSTLDKAMTKEKSELNSSVRSRSKVAQDDDEQIHISQRTQNKSQSTSPKPNDSKILQSSIVTRSRNKSIAIDEQIKEQETSVIENNDVKDKSRFKHDENEVSLKQNDGRDKNNHELSRERAKEELKEIVQEQDNNKNKQESRNLEEQIIDHKIPEHEMKQNKSQEIQDQIQEEQSESQVMEDENETEQNECQEIQDESEDEQNESQELQDESQELENKIQEMQNESQGMEEKNKKIQVESEKIQYENEEKQPQSQGESEKEQNESQEMQDISEDEQNETKEIQVETEEIQNENEGNQTESQEMEDKKQEILDESEEIQNEIEGNQTESQVMEDESQEEQNESKEMQDESEDEQNESLEIQDESLEGQSDNDEVQEESEERQSEREEIENGDYEQESEAENNLSQEVETENEEVDNQEIELDDENEFIDEEVVESDPKHESDQEEENDQNDYQDNNKKVDTDIPNISHDTTGRNRQKHDSPEVILHTKTNHGDSFAIHGQNTSVRKTKSMIKNKNTRLSLETVRESMNFSDGAKSSSAEGSGWDSHRTTRKTLRQTFGKDFTPRKSLRALVMEKSAKRQTLANDITSTTAKFPQANSTELPEESAHYVEVNHEPQESDHERRVRQTTLEMYLQKIMKQNMEKKAKIEEAVKNSLKAPPRDISNRFKVPRKPIFARRPITKTTKPKAKPVKSFIPLEDLPEEVIEDMKYKPPKRFQPSNAAWITKRLYKYLETKLENKYDYKARVRSEKLVESLYHFAKECLRHEVAAPDAIDVLKHEMARLDIVRTHFEFYEFFHEFMPREIRIRVIPDVVNNIPLPRHGVFSDILRGYTVQG